jgi:hypothetical protein
MPALRLRYYALTAAINSRIHGTKPSLPAIASIEGTYDELMQWYKDAALYCSKFKVGDNLYATQMNLLGLKIFYVR